ncbi:MAG: hypothetical protein IPM25_07045 [Chloracidobacterium sp.]|nr:hypothetical protein [Chloracidobacterium sp.]
MKIDELEKYERFLESRKRIPEKFVKTANTRDHFPIYFPCHLFDQNVEEWTGSDFIRLITFQITGMYTFHAQENVIILQEYINEFLLPPHAVPFSKSTMANSSANFKDGEKILFSYSFQTKENPTREDFLRKLSDFLKA